MEHTQKITFVSEPSDRRTAKRERERRLKKNKRLNDTSTRFTRWIHGKKCTSLSIKYVWNFFLRFFHHSVVQIRHKRIWMCGKWKQKLLFIRFSLFGHFFCLFSCLDNFMLISVCCRCPDWFYSRSSMAQAFHHF